MANPEITSSPGDGSVSAGATIQQNYLVREQQVVAVNENDLTELLTFDAVQQGLTGVGLFLLSGSTWLGIEKISEQFPLPKGGFSLTAPISLCVMAFLAGTVLSIAGLVIWRVRRRKIRRIFSETKTVN